MSPAELEAVGLPWAHTPGDGTARHAGTVAAMLLAVVLAAIVVAIARPQVVARSAERAAVTEADEIGDTLATAYTETRTYPQEVAGDNTDGHRPDVLADGRPLPAVRLAPGMVIAYYSAEGDLDFAFCLEHRTGSGEPDAFAVYSTGAPEDDGAVSQDGHGDGCAAAE